MLNLIAITSLVSEVWLAMDRLTHRQRLPGLVYVNLFTVFMTLKIEKNSEKEEEVLSPARETLFPTLIIMASSSSPLVQFRIGWFLWLTFCCAFAWYLTCVFGFCCYCVHLFLDLFLYCIFVCLVFFATWADVLLGIYYITFGLALCKVYPVLWLPVYVSMHLFMNCYPQ